MLRDGKALLPKPPETRMSEATARHQRSKKTALRDCPPSDGVDAPDGIFVPR